MKADPLQICLDEEEENQDEKVLNELIRKKVEDQIAMKTPIGLVFSQNLKAFDGENYQQKKEVLLNRIKKMFFDKHRFDISKQNYCGRREPPSNPITKNHLIVYGTDFWPTRSIVSEAKRLQIDVEAFQLDKSHTVLRFRNFLNAKLWLAHYEAEKQINQREEENMMDQNRVYKGWYSLKDYLYQGHTRHRQARFCGQKEETLTQSKKEAVQYIYELIIEEARQKLSINQQRNNLHSESMISNRSQYQRRDRELPAYNHKSMREVSRSREKRHKQHKQHKREKSRGKSFSSSDRIDEDNLSNFDRFEDRVPKHSAILESDLEINQITNELQKIDLKQNADIDVSMSVELQPKQARLNKSQQQELNFSVFSNESSRSNPKMKRQKRKKSKGKDDKKKGEKSSKTKEKPHKSSHPSSTRNRDVSRQRQSRSKKQNHKSQREPERKKPSTEQFDYQAYINNIEKQEEEERQGQERHRQ